MKSLVLACVVSAWSVACGGRTVGDVDAGDAGAKPDASGGDAATGSCATGQSCPAGYGCGFAQADGCTAQGQCVALGPMCNGFAPGCSCAGDTINVICNGLPQGYVPAPLAHSGACGASDGGTYACGSTSCVVGQDLCYIPANDPNAGVCIDLGGCTDCPCVQAQFQCISTCKQSGEEIYVECQ
jgi:hypothetical protein